MHFAERPPSTEWEQVPFLDSPHSFFWVWFKPSGGSNGLCFQIPEESFRDSRRRQPLTMRVLLQTVGVDPRSVAGWSLYGIPNEGQEGANPALDSIIPAPGPGVDPTIGVYLNIASSAAPPAAAGSPPTTTSASAEIFSRMETAWNASLQLETQLASVAKQLNAMVSRINGLNRDLSSEEFRYADQQDKREWQEARRWLRDIVTRLSRAIKDHAIGLTSAAGKRNGFEAIYKQYVVPRRSFDGLPQAEREFEGYRKSLQTLLNNMIAVHGTAAQDGDRRAQQILTRIASRVRAARAKR
jgi:hypothetical protein